MSLYVFKYFHLILKMLLMNYFQEIAEHLCPELICRIALEDDSGDIIP